MLELVSKGQDYVKKRKRWLGALWTEGEQGKAMRTEPLTRQTTSVSLTISGICLFIQRHTSERRAAGSWQHHIWFQHRVRWRAGQIWGLGAREALAGVHFTSWGREVTGWEGGGADLQDEMLARWWTRGVEEDHPGSTWCQWDGCWGNSQGKPRPHSLPWWTSTNWGHTGWEGPLRWSAWRELQHGFGTQ